MLCGRGDPVNILGICASHRKKKDTYKVLIGALEASGAEMDILQVSDLHILPCRACYEVCSENPYACTIDDDLPLLMEKMRDAHAILLASPLYSPLLVPSRLGIIIERLSCLSFFESIRRKKGEQLLTGKSCGIITVSGGSEPLELLKLLANFSLMLGLEVVTLNQYPYFGAWVKSPVEEDGEGMDQAKKIGTLLKGKIVSR
ncbi:MAG: flavodoxin family protein [Theionarchaea archaeon]|nr:flavodoxin family protein [Theionarchaea archaeon]